MKSISLARCSGNGNGGCFDIKRAHFKPKSLPDIVKTYITENYQVPSIVRAPVSGHYHPSYNCSSDLPHDRLLHLYEFASSLNVKPPTLTNPDDEIDGGSAKFTTDLAKRSGLSLPAFARQVRGQTSSDNRPNKALYELQVPATSQHNDAYRRWNDVVRNGVRPASKPTKPTRQTLRPVNHKSAHQHAAAVRKHIRKGQQDGRYLIFDESKLTLWPEIFISPIGVVDKAGGESRMINDYSHPPGQSVNDFTERDNFPSIVYNPPRDIARRIHDLRMRYPNAEVLLMLGDVSGAFCHRPVLRFGWCGSPAFYSLAGTTINDIYESYQPESMGVDDEDHFHGSVWCGDHTCVETNTGTRCRDANIALRQTMATVIGPASINDKKFTPWCSINKALGLIWNTATGTVAIPAENLDKASQLVANLLEAGRATKSELTKLLGVFHHVVTCFPAARAFYQRTHVASVAMPQYGKRPLDDEVFEGLRWFNAVLVHRDRFNSVLMAQFATNTIPTVYVYMDASNTGLCALEPQRKEFIRVQYTKEECEALASGSFDRSINIRELQSAVLAALLWGPHWQKDTRAPPVYVCLHIDNTSAVAWSSRRYSRHPIAQLYNRLLSITELQFQLSISAEHIPGKLNTMADVSK